MRVSRLLQHWVQEAAEQLDGKSVWHRCCEHLEQVLAAIGSPKAAPAITFASGSLPFLGSMEMVWIKISNEVVYRPGVPVAWDIRPIVNG